METLMTFYGYLIMPPFKHLLDLNYFSQGNYLSCWEIIDIAQTIIGVTLAKKKIVIVNRSIFTMTLKIILIILNIL
jgi:hypothetical protein